MKRADLLLSYKPTHRVVRHLVFWIIYCSYFYIQSLAPRKFEEFSNADTWYFAFLNLCCFAPFFIFAVYFSIYFLLPRLLQQKKYVLFLISFLVLYAFGTVINYFMAGIFLSNVNYSTPIEVNFRHKMEFGNYNTRWGMVIAIIAMGIKLSKTWFLQQKENLEMLKKRSRREVQLQKAKMHPEFLLRSLDTISDHLQSGSGQASSIILNLAEILSYSVYENGKDLVPWEAELTHLKKFIDLQLQGAAPPVDITIQSNAGINNKYIVPLVMIKFLEESIAVSHKMAHEVQIASMHIYAIDNQVTVSLLFSHLGNQPDLSAHWHNVVSSTTKRLNEYYSPGDYQVELKDYLSGTKLALGIKLADDPKAGKAVKDVNPKAAIHDIL